jgi:isochorismate synthase
MISEDFFAKLHQHYNNIRPFVAYRKPNNVEVKALLQKDNTIHFVNDYSEHGFVFSPFDNKEKAIVMPLKASEAIKTDFVLSSDMDISLHKTKHSESEKLQHIQLVQKGIDVIKNNTIQKVVLSRYEVVDPSEDNPVNIFKRLLNKYDTAFVYCWYHPKVGVWLGATPETLVQITGNRFKTMALAGTKKYNGTDDVIWDNKEKKEQQYVTDFIVESLKDSVENLNVSKPITVKAGNVLHLKTVISGILQSDLNNIIKKLHPTPAVCGLPKEKAKQFILKEENYKREFYTGFLGELNIKEKQLRNTNRQNVENNAYASIKTSSHLFVNLRCMQLKDSKALIYVGGGITNESDAEEEWQETINKTLTIKAVLD